VEIAGDNFILLKVNVGRDTGGH